MSANHKRPLLAFVLVAFACTMIIANGVRTQAVVGVVRAGAQHLVTGVGFVVADASAEPAVATDDSGFTPVGPVEVAAQRVFGGGRPLASAGHVAVDRKQSKVDRSHPAGQARQHTEPVRGRTQGHGHGLGHDRAKGPAAKPGKSHRKSHVKSHVQSLFTSLFQGHLKGHAKKSHGKGHAKKGHVQSNRSHSGGHGKAHTQGRDD